MRLPYINLRPLIPGAGNQNQSTNQPKCYQCGNQQIQLINAPPLGLTQALAAYPALVQSLAQM